MSSSPHTIMSTIQLDAWTPPPPHPPGNWDGIYRTPSNLFFNLTNGADIPSGTTVNLSQNFIRFPQEMITEVGLPAVFLENIFVVTLPPDLTPFDILHLAWTFKTLRRFLMRR